MWYHARRRGTRAGSGHDRGRHHHVAVPHRGGVARSGRSVLGRGPRSSVFDPRSSILDILHRPRTAHRVGPRVPRRTLLGRPDPVRGIGQPGRALSRLAVDRRPGRAGAGDHRQLHPGVCRAVRLRNGRLADGGSRHRDLDRAGDRGGAVPGEGVVGRSVIEREDGRGPARYTKLPTKASAPSSLCGRSCPSWRLLSRFGRHHPLRARSVATCATWWGPCHAYSCSMRSSVIGPLTGCISGRAKSSGVIASRSVTHR